MITNAMPLSWGMFSKNSLIACSPPADAPMPTTGKSRVLGLKAFGPETVSERLGVVVMTSAFGSDGKRLEFKRWAAHFNESG